MKIIDLLNFGRKFLDNGKISDFDFDAKELLCYALNLNGTELLLRLSDEVPEEKINSYKLLLQKRASGMPLQYIIGKWYFLGNEFNVGKGVLIPRPETEELTDICIKYSKCNNIKYVFDLCSGSGCIGISIAKALPDTVVYLFEKYPDAAAYAESNIKKYNLNNIKLIVSDIFEGKDINLPLPDLIVSNPPYIPCEEISGLQQEVCFEPRTALDGGADGLDFYRCIYSEWLSGSKKTKCAFECGENQAEIISDMFSAYGKTDTVKDLYGTERFVFVNF